MSSNFVITPSQTELAPARWLKPGGAILPDTATIFLAAASRAALDISFWDDVYGFSYNPVQDEMLEHAFTHAGKRLLHVHPCFQQTLPTQVGDTGLTSGPCACRCAPRARQQHSVSAQGCTPPGLGHHAAR